MGKMVLMLVGLFIFAIGLTIFKSSQNTAPPAQAIPSPTATTATSSGSPSQEPVKSENPQTEVFTESLSVPWAIAFLPDGNLLVTERAGSIRLIDKNGNLRSETAAKISEVRQTGEGGLHGIAVDPDFENSKLIFVYYTYRDSGENTLNRVSSFRYYGSSFTDQKIVVDQIPGAGNHDGGRLKFGADGALYITTGDAANPSLSQDKNSLAGKILRYKDGEVEAFSLGHRNPQGIAWDSQGRLWEVEHGSSATDEINLISQGKNYGWPDIRGDQTSQGMENPVRHSGSETWAPAGMAFYNGSLYFGGLRGQALFQYNIESKELKTHFKGEFGRIREVILGPDNLLYITTSNKDGRGIPFSGDDKIIRINPDKL